MAKLIIELDDGTRSETVISPEVLTLILKEDDRLVAETGEESWPAVTAHVLLDMFRARTERL